MEQDAYQWFLFNKLVRICKRNRVRCNQYYRDTKSKLKYLRNIMIYFEIKKTDNEYILDKFGVTILLIIPFYFILFFYNN